jgi:hypothetical protein
VAALDTPRAESARAAGPGGPDEPDECEVPGSSLRVALAVALPFAAYAALLAAACLFVPYRPALDDPEIQHLARHWVEHGRLAADGLFVRVPLWQMLVGSANALFGERAGIVVLQAAIVFAALCLFARRNSREGALGAGAVALALLFASSPQLVLFSRHTANELFVGTLAMAAFVLGERVDARRAAALGAVVAAAMMTKLAAAVLLVPAILQLRAARATLAPARGAWRFALGFGGVALPLYVLAVSQRGFWLLDNTSAFNLGSLDQETWRALGDAALRQRAGMESFWATLGADPVAYASAAAARALDWLLHTGSLDLFLWIEGYPQSAVEIGDALAFFGVLTLALLGTTRRTALVWIFPLAIWAACSFPQKTPYSPKIAILFPLLLLAPAGLASLGAMLGRGTQAAGSDEDAA